MISRSRFIAVLLVELGLLMASQPAVARTHHRAHHSHHHAHRHHIHRPHKTHAHRTTHHKQATLSPVREAQTHLKNLGLYNDAIDGATGPRFRSALREFQRAHRLKATGILNKKTLAALRKSDRYGAGHSFPLSAAAGGPQDFFATHPDFYGHYDQNYADPLMLARHYADSATQTIPNRFAQLNVTETPNVPARLYDVTLNGESVLRADNQPSVIGISRTFAVEDEDLIIFSTYRAHDPICATKHYLLALRPGSSAWYPIESCTRTYQAEVKNSLLTISFPEHDDQRAISAVWRYERSNLVKL